MKIIKAKLLIIFGSISSFFGAAGVAISAFGLCPCVLVPLLSVVGVVTIFMGFLTNQGIYFLIIGVVMLIFSLVLSKKRKV